MKILYVSTISNTINAFMIPHIKMLVEKEHSVDVACNVQKDISATLVELGCRVHDISFSRSPLNITNVNAYYDLKKVILDQNYDIIHTHTPIASAITRVICRNLKNVRVFYTVHGFHFYKGASFINWLFYYPIEKLLAKYTDTLITINEEDFKRAKSGFNAKRIEYIPGVGLNINKLRDVVVDKVSKRKEIGVPQEAFVILSVGEVNKNKNHEIIIKAMAKLNSPNVHYVICGKGPLEGYLIRLSDRLRIKENVHLLGFRSDVAMICKSSDVFAFPSLREGLGMAALEALACELPIITSRIHGIMDYSVDGKTGYTCNPKCVDGFTEALKKILFLHENEKAYEFKKSNIELIKKFDISNVLLKLEHIYFGS